MGEELEALAADLDEPEASRPEEPATNPPDDVPEPRIDRARLVAFQMIMAGSRRDEVELYLRESFGVADPGPLVDEVAETAPR